MSQDTNKMTKHAGLIAFFYGRRGQMSDLQENIGQALNLPSAQTKNPEMSDQHHGIILERKDSASNHDTTVIYLTLSQGELNQPDDDAATVWSQVRPKFQKRLFRSINNATIKTDPQKPAPFWGYTLIYYATVVEDQAIDEEMQKKLLKLARRPDLPDLSEAEEAIPLAHTKAFGSDLWLMSIPDQWHGAQAATVYAALAPENKEDEFIWNILLGPNAALQELDLIAHKAYYERRQFVSQPTTSEPVLRKAYKAHIGKLRDSISPFLGSTGKRKNFQKLKAKYEKLLLATSILDEPRLSLAQQLTNYEWWQKQLDMADIAEYHHRQIDITLKEVELLMDKGQRMLAATQTTIEMEQAELSQKRDERETLIAVLLGILGVALAVSQTIDASAAEALLALFANLTRLPLAADNRLAQLLVQFLITGLVAGGAFWAYQWSRSKETGDL